MIDQPPAPVPSWTIDHVEDALVVGDGRLGTRGKRVYYRLLNGTMSYVEVPIRDYTPDRVSQLVNDAAERDYGIHGLQGPSIPGS